MNNFLRESVNSEEGYAPLLSHDGLANDGRASQPPLGDSSEATARRVSISELFMFADSYDKFMIFVGIISAAITGSIMPVYSIIYGRVVDAFNDESKSDSELRHTVNSEVWMFVVLAIAALVSNYAQNVCFVVSAERQSRRLKEEYFDVVLRQDIGWFDTCSSGELATRIKNDAIVWNEGISFRFGRLIQAITTFGVGFGIGFYHGWKLAVVMLTAVPVLMVAGGVMMAVITGYAQKEQERYAKAGGIAEESLSSIRTVASFNGEQKALARYEERLKEAEVEGIKGSKVGGMGIGFVFLVIFSCYGLGMWYGGKEVADDEERGCTHDCQSGGNILTVFWSVIMGAMALGQVTPSVTALGSAKGVALKLVELLEREPAIDASSQIGDRLPTVAGELQLDDVTFRYPSRPDATIFEGFSLNVKAGGTLALVGPSGQGKSTVVALLERFYDPEQGRVLLDGVDIRTLNVGWLRDQIGLVSQEPTLFATSIAENIRYGKEGATDEEVEEAAKKANAHDFITAFPDQYQTQVGEKGIQLSGGQKQRIAIARAIIKDPSILLLDEATSALDTQSEREVQDALDALLKMKRRTTVVIAHRLSTIQGADSIAVVSGGRVVEQGTHEELMRAGAGTGAGAGEGGDEGTVKSHYATLVSLQESAEAHAGAERRRGSSVSFQGVPAAPVEEDEDTAAAGAESSSMWAPTRWPSTSTWASFRASLASIAPPASRSNSSLINDSGDSSSSSSSSSSSNVMSRLWRLNSPDKALVSVAVVAGVFQGSMWPTFSVLLSNVVMVFYRPDPEDVRDGADLWALMFVALAVAMMFSMAAMVISFGTLGQRLTRRLRSLSFAAMIRQDVSWFDREENNSGALCARLSTEVTLVKKIVGENLSTQVQIFVTIVSAMVIALVFGSWKLSLVLISISPLLVWGFKKQMEILAMETDRNAECLIKSGQITNEALTGIRTVTALGLSPRVRALYSQTLEEPERVQIHAAHVTGLAGGLTMGLTLSTYALGFWYGAILVTEQGVSFTRLLRSLMVVMMSAQGLGQTANTFGDHAAAREAAKNIFKVVDRQPSIDSAAASGATIPNLQGAISFKNVHFRYPSRPAVSIFHNLSLSVPAGGTLALVGPSGQGKSTVVALLERFYDPEQGRVLLDGVDIRTLNVGWLRDQIGLVSQEPTLFATSIAENIRYGKEGATDEEVEEAAKKANAHDFITAFPDQYQTQVGEKGIQLSGGQKQRIAIARAIIKDPSILLLDEATSALDTQSEREVQDALDALLKMKRRTTVVIAHRLSTIQGADSIAVVSGGRVVEQGTHGELIRAGGHYKRLWDTNK